MYKAHTPLGTCLRFPSVIIRVFTITQNSQLNDNINAFDTESLSRPCFLNSYLTRGNNGTNDSELGPGFSRTAKVPRSYKSMCTCTYICTHDLATRDQSHYTLYHMEVSP